MFPIFFHALSTFMLIANPIYHALFLQFGKIKSNSFLCDSHSRRRKSHNLSPRLAANFLDQISLSRSEEKNFIERERERGRGRGRGRNRMLICPNLRETRGTDGGETANVRNLHASSYVRCEDLQCLHISITSSCKNIVGFKKYII